MTSQHITLIHRAYDTRSLRHAITFSYLTTKASVKQVTSFLYGHYINHMLGQKKMISWIKLIYFPPSKENNSTYILRKSMTTGDKGEAPEHINRTLPPSFSFILLNTNLSQMGDGSRPEFFFYVSNKFD